MSKPNAIVGIGASAGGLEALQNFVRAIPNDSGIAYVVVQHLAPDHPSIMDRLLAEHANLAVSKIEDEVRLAADHVYVIPAGPFAEVKKGRFKLTDHAREEGVRTPIDRFFTSLAEEAGRDAFAVVLSGTGSDGTIGVRSVKENGGIALVQESDSARFPGMPNSAAATGLVDFVLRPAEMPDKIIEIVEHRRMLDWDGKRDRLAEDIETRLSEILDAIDEDANISFSDYKPGTLVRRVMRRMTILRQSVVDDYLETLRENGEERTLLSQDFLIGVTEFFRDPDGFEALTKKVLRPILERENGQVRIWVPGCSTGEEAFTIAILADEILQEIGQTRHIQVFGTDVDHEALRHARHGRYAEAALKNVSDERRERYFHKANDYWHVLPRLREMCVFAPHDLLGDPPFSRLDLISCRNVMIYLSVEAQASVIPKFHYALNAGGYLWLGPSETLGRSERFFLTEDRPARIFRRNDDVTRAFSALNFKTPKAHDKLPKIARQSRAEPRDYGVAPKTAGLGEEAEQAFLKLYASPFAIVSREGEVLYLSEGMTRFVQPSEGAPATNVEDFLSPELRLPVQSAVDQVIESKAETNICDVVAQVGGKPCLFDVFAAPFCDGHDQIMIVLKEVRQRGTVEHSSEATQSNRVAELERELALTRRRLHTVEREYEAAAQDLRSSNEELLTMNEEMQSSNEELETSREELQSINEELETINAELTENNRQLTRSNSDLQNLLQSTDVGILFLNQADCVRLYTPALSELFGVRERDMGRPIHQLSTRLDYPELKDDIAEVRRTLEPRMREVRIPQTDETFEARIRPYRTIDNRLDGVVITFQDVSARRRNEKQLADNARVLDEQLSELQTLYDKMPVGIAVYDREMRFIRMNQKMAEIDGISAEEHLGERGDELLPGVPPKVKETILGIFESGEGVYELEVQAKTPAQPGVLRDFVCDYFPIVAKDEVIAVGTCVREVTDELQLKRKLAEQLSELETLYNTVPVGLNLLDHDLRFLRINKALADINGLPVDDHIGKLERDIVPEIFDQCEPSQRKVLETGEPVFGDTVRGVTSADPSREREWVVDYFPVKADGKTIAVGSSVREVTQERELERALAESEGRLRRLFDNVPALIGIHEGTNHHNLYLNAKADELLEGEDNAGLSFAEAAESGAAIKALFDEVFETGEPQSWEDLEMQVPDDAPGFDHVRLELVPWYEPSGKIGGVMSFAFDITAQRHALEQQEILLRELQHRVKNVLAIVQAIVRFAARTARTKQDLEEALTGRLAAVSRTHEALTADNWRGRKLRDLIEDELAPFINLENNRFSYDGPDLTLEPKVALTLGLAFHELATNAAKYGSLTDRNGRVEVKAEARDGELSRLEWLEIDGPEVAPPQGEGFGSFLLKRIIGAELNADVRVDYNNGGMRYLIEQKGIHGSPG
ncbi:MAG: PAS domain-containing protein [Rhodobacteraceae bacterium]|jgi:two-component system CheB/CheR fusion protein|nr:PAS domain-containing protein [Paracoccaceae bacterium]